METVKKERVSPLLDDAAVYKTPDTRPPCPQAPTTTDTKSGVKPYLANLPPAATASLPSVITATTTHNETSAQRPPASSCRTNGPSDSEITQALGNFSGEISDAVSKILDDYDWSKIPLANKDGGVDSERRKVHVKRPMNAFMVWAQEARRRLSCSHRQVHNAELSKSLGRIWRGMTEDQKRPFIERADHLRRKHKQEYPDYKYQPRRRKENVKTVNKSPQGGSLADAYPLANHHFVSGVKGPGLGLMHPLSPPHSPSGVGSVRGHESSLGETVFVAECLNDTFETIDRAEMNKYLLPDQGHGAQYASAAAAAAAAHASSGSTLQPMTPMTTMTAMSSMNTMSGAGATTCTSMTSGGSTTLSSLPTLSRLVPPAPVYGGPASPYYTGGASPQPGSHGSPDGMSQDPLALPPSGGVSPGGSPDSPHSEYVELQPSRVPKEEPLPPLTAPKPSNVNPFLHQNSLCYSTQPYTFQYSYPYAPMWH